MSGDNGESEGLRTFQRGFSCDVCGQIRCYGPYVWQIIMMRLEHAIVSTVAGRHSTRSLTVLYCARNEL